MRGGGGWLDREGGLTALACCAFALAFPGIETLLQETDVHHNARICEASFCPRAVVEGVLDFVVELTQRDQMAEYFIGGEFAVFFQLLRPFGHVGGVLEQVWLL